MNRLFKPKGVAAGKDWWASGAGWHARGVRSPVHPAQLLSSLSGVAVHILCHRHGGFIPQFLELSIQRRRLEPELLAVSQESRVGWCSSPRRPRPPGAYCHRRKDAITPRRVFLEAVVDRATPS